MCAAVSGTSWDTQISQQVDGNEIKEWIHGLSDLAIKAIAHEMLNLVANHQRRLGIYQNYIHGINMLFMETPFQASSLTSENEKEIPCIEGEPLGGIMIEIDGRTYMNKEALYHPSALEKIIELEKKTIHFTEKFPGSLETNLEKYGSYIKELLQNDKSIEEGFVFTFSRISIRGKFGLDLHKPRVRGKDRRSFRAPFLTYNKEFIFKCDTIRENDLKILFEITTSGGTSSPFKSERKLFKKLSHVYSVKDLVDYQDLLSKEIAKKTACIAIKTRRKFLNRIKSKTI